MESRTEANSLCQRKKKRNRRLESERRKAFFVVVAAVVAVVVGLLNPCADERDEEGDFLCSRLHRSRSLSRLDFLNNYQNFLTIQHSSYFF